MIESDYFEGARVLVTVDLSKPGWKDLTPFEMLSSMDVVLLGFHPIPDQTTPEQAEDQLGEEAQRRLDELEKRFDHAGISVVKRLVFSGDFKKTLDTLADEENCTAILTWNERMNFDRIGVFLRADQGRDNIVNNLAAMMVNQDQEVELIHFISEDSEIDDAESRSILETERDYLVDRGCDEERISIRVDRVSDVDEALSETSNEYDAIVMGETKPSTASEVFGTRHELVQENAEGPVLVVRYPEED